jgi:Tfp pilus assembly protein PilF
VWRYANFLQTIESFDEAQQFYQRTIAADPNNADALNNLVRGRSLALGATGWWDG